ncbi:uncharacterized protein LOC141719058 [Apium graveolens]|uniref:uncharacterized protein LOC141719058 n=1 Tax=Apium graveolens TaxID=4045 RepID=UPI003D7B34BE
MCKLLPKVIMTVQRTTTVGGLQCDISKWHQLRLDGSSTRLCTSLAEDKNIPYSDKALANTKEEQLGYGPKSEFKCINSDSSTDNSDNDVFFYEAEIRAIDMEEREAQIQTEILANTEGELYRYNPKIKYEPLKRYDVPRFVFSEDSSTDCSDIESEAKMKPWLNTEPGRFDPWLRGQLGCGAKQ